MHKIVSRLSDNNSQNLKSVNSKKSKGSLSNSVSPNGQRRRTEMTGNCHHFIQNVVHNQNKSTENLLTASLSNNENSTQVFFRNKKNDNYGTT